MKNDPVNHPEHYTRGGIECIDALTAMVTGYPDPNDACLTWQVGKYIWRHPFKAKPVEDLKKAKFYLERLISYLEAKDAAPAITESNQKPHSLPDLPLERVGVTNPDGSKDFW